MHRGGSLRPARGRAMDSILGRWHLSWTSKGEETSVEQRWLEEGSPGRWTPHEQRQSQGVTNGDGVVNALDSRPASVAFPWLQPPGSVRDFFPAQFCAAKKETEFGASETGFYLTAREWRRGDQSFKSTFSPGDGSKRILRARRPQVTRTLGKWWKLLSHVRLCDPLGCSPPGFLCPWDFPGKNTWVGCHPLLQGIFLTQRSNPGLLHSRQILYHLSHQGSPGL